MKVPMFQVSTNTLLIIYHFVMFYLIALSKALFEYKYAIGRGGFGKVWRVSSNRLKNEKTA